MVKMVAAVVATVAGALALVGAALAGFSYWRARALLKPYRKPMKAQPEDYGLIVEEVHIPGPRGAMSGWYLPSQNGCTLVCLHGINDNSGQWFEQVAELHARGGYGALMFDFAGHGRSDGKIVTYGAGEQLDVHAALAHLRGRGDVDMSRLGLMGYSLGAITAILYAARHPVFQAVVIESGFADIERDIEHLFTRYTGLPSFPFANLIIFWMERISGYKLSALRPMRVIGRISPGAVYIISDLEDTLAVEPYDGEHLYGGAGEPKELWQAPATDHVQAFNTNRAEWIERVGGFLDRYLARAPHESGELLADPQGPEVES
jgi:pimeloyl-ACP methyl ester carboxylesterase